MINRRIKSSSIVEVTTAMVIISMVFTMAIGIYLNVQNSGFSSQRLAAEITIEEAFATLMKNKKFENKEMNIGDIVVSQAIVRAAGSVDLLTVSFEARSQEGKLLAEQKHLVYASGFEQ